MNNAALEGARRTMEEVSELPTRASVQATAVQVCLLLLRIYGLLTCPGYHLAPPSLGPSDQVARSDCVMFHRAHSPMAHGPVVSL